MKITPGPSPDTLPSFLYQHSATNSTVCGLTSQSYTSQKRLYWKAPSQFRPTGVINVHECLLNFATIKAHLLWQGFNPVTLESAAKHRSHRSRWSPTGVNAAMPFAGPTMHNVFHLASQLQTIAFTPPPQKWQACSPHTPILL